MKLGQVSEEAKINNMGFSKPSGSGMFGGSIGALNNEPSLSQKLCALSDEGIKIYSLFCSADYQKEELKKEDGFPEFKGAEQIKFSNGTGDTLGVVNEDGLHLVDMSSKKVRLVIQRKGIVALKWSPKNTMIVTCEK